MSAKGLIRRVVDKVQTIGNLPVVRRAADRMGDRLEKQVAAQGAKNAQIKADRERPQAAVSAAIDRQRQALASPGPRQVAARRTPASQIPMGTLDQIRQQTGDTSSIPRFVSSIGATPTRRK